MFIYAIKYILFKFQNQTIKYMIYTYTIAKYPLLLFLLCIIILEIQKEVGDCNSITTFWICQRIMDYLSNLRLFLKFESAVYYPKLTPINCVYVYVYGFIAWHLYKMGGGGESTTKYDVLYHG